MNRKFIFGISAGTILVIIGISLSVSANYGLIKEAKTFEKVLSFPMQGWTESELLAELNMEPGRTVTIELVHWTITGTPGKTFSVYVKDDFDNTIITRTFVFEPGRLIRWEPDIENPIYLFEAQTWGKYTVYASTTNEPEDYSWDDLTFHVVVTSPPPYAIVMLLGFVMLALGIIVMVLGVLFGLRKPSEES